MRWRAAPRLDLVASGAAQDVGETLGGNGWVRASLKLDDRGEGNLGTEVRRVDLPGAQWTGVRAIAALPLGSGFRYSSELEIVVPDYPDRRGAAWPWGLVALYIAVFPANIHMAMDHIQLTPDGTFPVWAMWLRLPFQALFIAWAYWMTRPDPAS